MIDMIIGSFLLWVGIWAFFISFSYATQEKMNGDGKEWLGVFVGSFFGAVLIFISLSILVREVLRITGVS